MLSQLTRSVVHHLSVDLRKVSDAQFSVMREEAVRLVRGGVVQDAGYPRERHFEVSCDDTRVMLVDNPLKHLVIVMYAGRENDASCVEPMLSHWSRRVVPE